LTQRWGGEEASSPTGRQQHKDYARRTELESLGAAGAREQTHKERGGLKKEPASPKAKKTTLKGGRRGGGWSTARGR